MGLDGEMRKENFYLFLVLLKFIIMSMYNSVVIIELDKYNRPMFFLFSSKTVLKKLPMSHT